MADARPLLRPSRHAAGLELRMLDWRFSAATLIGHMRRDKTVRDGTVQFVLARGVGQTFTMRDVPVEAVTELLRDEGCGA